MGEGHSSSTGRRGISPFAAKRLAEKHATDTYLTPEQREAVQASERETQDWARERANIARANGELIRGRTGTPYKSHLPHGPHYADDVITHNHPDADFIDKNSIAARIGTSLSGQDFKVLINDNRRAIRAKTHGYVFSLEKPKGVEIPRIDASKAKAYHTRTYNRLYRQYMSGGYTNSDRAYAVAVHKAAEATAKKFGLKYTRKPSRPEKAVNQRHR